MAKIICVLYDDPVDGYPTSYARESLPEIRSRRGAKLVEIDGAASPAG